MEAINLHKQMAMGKGYPTSINSSDKAPTPTHVQPKTEYKTIAKMKVEKINGEGNK